MTRPLHELVAKGGPGWHEKGIDCDGYERHVHLRARPLIVYASCERSEADFQAAVAANEQRHAMQARSIVVRLTPRWAVEAEYALSVAALTGNSRLFSAATAIREALADTAEAADGG